MRYGQKLDPNKVYGITSDLHFGHKNILKFCSDTRPWSNVEEMEDNLLDEINSLGLDVLFHLGDFSFYGKDKTKEILDKINCDVVFIGGNHDKVLRNQFGNKIDFHEYLTTRYKGTKLCLFHYAMRVWDGQGRGSVHFYGHSHGSLPEYKRSMDVGYDAQGKVLMLEDAVNKMLLVEDFKGEDNH